MPKTKTFDPSCYELAKRFAADLDGVSDVQVRNLSSAIQTAIEDWIEDNYTDPSRHQVAAQ